MTLGAICIHASNLMLPWISQKPHQVKATSVGTVEFLRLLLRAIEHYRPTTANCKFPLNGKSVCNMSHGL